MKKKLSAFIKKRLSAKYLVGLSLLVALIFITSAHPLQASIMQDVANIVNSIFAGIINALGAILVVLMYLVIWISSYNGFITSAAVSNGWTIVRDLCNMFFILILLIIAFATVLNLESFAWKKLLPKVLIVAVLINFSKLICGLIIDFAQVIMLTFVNGFRDIGGGNLVTMLGVEGLLNLTPAAEVSILGVMATYVLALLYIIVSIGVIIIILFVLVMRMVMLWILIVLSPLAYLLKILPKTSGHADTWFKQFGENVASGPILAFFIWLSFASVTINTNTDELLGNTSRPGQTEDEYSWTDAQAMGAGMAQAGTPDGMMRFVISIGLLMGGVMMTKQLGGAVGSTAGRVSDKLQKAGSWAGKKMGGAAKKGAVNTGKLAARSGLTIAGGATGLVGKGMSKVTGGRVGNSFEKGGAFMSKWGSDLRSTRQKDKEKKRKETLEKLGMKEDSMDALADFQKTALARSFKGTIAVAAGVATGNAALIYGGGAYMAYQLGPSGKTLKDHAKEIRIRSNISKAEKTKDKIYGQIKGEQDAIDNDEKLTNLEKIKKHADLSDKYRPIIDTTVAAVEAFKQKNVRALDAILSVKDSEGATNTGLELSRQRRRQELNKAKEMFKDAPSAVRKDRLKEINDKYDAQERNIKEQHQIFADDPTGSKRAAKDLEEEKKNLVSDSDKKRDEELLEAAEALKGAAKEIKAAKVREINQKYDNLNQRISSEYKDRIDSIKQNNVPEIGISGLVPTAMNWLGKKADTYTPNRLTIAAAKLGAKEYSDARDKRSALSETDIGQFSSKDFSTPTGPNSGQEKLFKVLADKSDLSNKALERIIQGLKDIKSSGKQSKDVSATIDAMMRGIAHVTDKDSSLKAALSKLSYTLEDVHQEGKKVSDFKPKSKS